MRITVIGGGVAGSAAAVALRHVGAEVTVFEAYPDPAGPVGSFVSIAANGLRALDALGCLPAVQAAGFPVDRQRMWSGGGKLLGDVARARRPDDDRHSVTLRRADLVTALRDAATAGGATVVTGTRSGYDTEADLVVGADGIWSATRARLDPTAPNPRYGGLYTVSGTAALPDGLPSDGFNWVFARRGVFIHLPTPTGQVWWSAQISSPAEPADPAATDLADVFRSEPAALAVLCSDARVTSATPRHVLAPVRVRHDDRTVLIGDASHPAGAGQGASIALEDAVVLARNLAPFAGHRPPAGAVAAALAAFDAQRRDRTGKLARMEQSNGDAKTAGPIATRMRELVMPLVFNRCYERATGWLYDFDPGTLPHAG